MSLKKNLNEYIKLKGEVEYQDLKLKCETGYWGRYYRATTMERRLRNESLEVQAVYENGTIKRYKYTGDTKPEERPIKKIVQLEDRVILYQ